MKTTKVTLWSDHLGEDDELDARTLIDLLAKIPPEHLDSAALRVRYDTEGVVPLEISYIRPETDAERQKRERDKAESDARWQRETYQREIAEFARLKAKFEGKQ